MSYPKRDQNSPLAKELRNRGFIPLPRLWVKSEDMDDIREITDKRAKEVNDVRKYLRISGKLTS